MHAVHTQAVSVYVDRLGGRWVVRDTAGRFWQLPPSDDPWRDREEFTPDDGAELEPVPGHYKYMLGLPH
jgi:hypothetical protein